MFSYTKDNLLHRCMSHVRQIMGKLDWVCKYYKTFYTILSHQLACVIIFALAVIVYDLAVYLALFDNPAMKKYARLVSSLTAGVMSLTLIIIMSKVSWELPLRLPLEDYVLQTMSFALTNHSRQTGDELDLYSTGEFLKTTLSYIPERRAHEIVWNCPFHSTPVSSRCS